MICSGYLSTGDMSLALSNTTGMQVIRTRPVLESRAVVHGDRLEISCGESGKSMLKLSSAEFTTGTALQLCEHTNCYPSNSELNERQSAGELYMCEYDVRKALSMKIYNM